MRRKLSDTEISIREAAKIAGEKYYFFTCPQGHENSRRRVRDTACGPCHALNVKQRKRHRYNTEPAYRLYLHAQHRSRMDSSVAFSIQVEDILAVWPPGNMCPIFGWPLQQNRVFHDSLVKIGPCPQSPTLDRIDPKKGYVVGNIAVMSHKANLVKQDVTDPVIFERLAQWLRTHGF